MALDRSPILVSILSPMNLLLRRVFLKGESINEFKSQFLNERNPSLIELMPQLVKNVLVVKDKS